jgi:hypothetical protein
MKGAYTKTDGLDDPLSFPRPGPFLYWVCRIATGSDRASIAHGRLTRRRSPDAPDECWHVYFGDVRVGTIAIRTGMPPGEDPWGWA